MSHPQTQSQSTFIQLTPHFTVLDICKEMPSSAFLSMSSSKTQAILAAVVSVEMKCSDWVWCDSKATNRAAEDVSMGLDCEQSRNSKYLQL